MAPGQGFHLRGLQDAARAFGQVREVHIWHSVCKCPSSKGTGGAVRDPPDCATADAGHLDGVRQIPCQRCTSHDVSI